MKKFKFRLEAVLKVAEIKKEQTEIAFAEATNALLAEQEKLKSYENELAQAMEDYYKIENKKITIELLTSYNTYFFRLRMQIQSQQTVILEAEKKRQACLEEFRAALNRLKSIEKLKQRRFAEFQEQELAEEQKMLDEIGLQIYTRVMR